MTIKSTSFLTAFSYMLIVFFIGISSTAFAQPQTQRDSYTKYELLAPETNSFRIIYDVSATTSGAIYYYNTLRKGSEHHIDAVFDRMTGGQVKPTNI